jgi:hypothetical protein
MQPPEFMAAAGPAADERMRERYAKYHRELQRSGESSGAES